ncbi:hypothetical protein E0H51_31545 [Rhizobium leguminosarum bv. viciae]|uniref:ABC-three component system protein n=1 Tax=Rhizobium leguminosarum TaxID=384 RepID=UPI00103DF3AF|nr:ABC-three component system protein [Rhizobium leguminosarum]TBY68945.1 hypothetical protein E0H51_31545 [Rhizobium leguminosarum bv. viciae]
MSLSKRIKELEDDQLEEFVDIWAERKSKDYVKVERLGQANDKGRDVVGFVTSARHEGEWDLFQCKRKTLGSLLGLGEAMTELGKVFFHHVDGAYTTLPRRYVFVTPRGVEQSLKHLLEHPTKLQEALLANWDKYCRKKITAKKVIELTPEIRATIEAYEFKNVDCLTAPSIAKDAAARPALVQVLKELPGEAPEGHAPDDISDTEFAYLQQLRDVYSAAAGAPFSSFDEILADHRYGEGIKVHRTRFYEACAFRDFHRDNTDEKAVDVFKKDIYHLLFEVYNEAHPSLLDRVNAVMKHTGAHPAAILGRMARSPVKQGTCHHLVTDGKIRWSP